MEVTAQTIMLATGLDEAAATKSLHALRRAEADVRSLIGNEEYDRVAAIEEEGDEEVDDLTEALSLLCLVYALPTLNVRVTEKGGLVSAVGFEQSRTELMSQGALQKLQHSMRGQAHSLLRRFTPGIVPHTF
jgi:hypothetical protein